MAPHLLSIYGHPKIQHFLEEDSISNRNFDSSYPPKMLIIRFKIVFFILPDLKNINF